MAEDKGRLYLGYLLSSHFVIHVFTFLLPVLLLPFQEELGISLVQLSLLSSIPKLLNVLIYIPSGVMSDRYPSQTLTASFAITVIASMLIPSSTNFPELIPFHRTPTSRNINDIQLLLCWHMLRTCLPIFWTFT